MVYLKKNDENISLILKTANINKVSTFSGDGLEYMSYKAKNFYTDKDGYLITREWNEDRPEVLTIHNYKKYEDEIKIDFDYKINSHGFRSNHFKKIDNKKTSILYSGCSWTFGMGLPEEYTWTNMLTKKIAKDNIEEYNIGYRAFSIYLIIKNIMSFIRTYGKPSYLFIVFPDSGRDFIFNKYSNNYSNVDPRYFEYTSDFVAEYTNSYSYETNIVKYIDMIKLLEDFCNSNNIKFLWTTWYYPDYEIYKNIGFENLCPTDTSFLQADPGFYRIFNKNSFEEKYPYENKQLLPYWSVARDLVHPGTAWTTHIVEEFLNEIKSRGI